MHLRIPSAYLGRILTPSQKEALSTTFKCVFCNNENSVTISIDKKNNISTLTCRSCGQNFQSKSQMMSMPFSLPHHHQSFSMY